MEKHHRILIVEDEEPNRLLLGKMVASFGYEPELAQDGIEALAKLSLDIDLVLLDIMMPGMDGFEVVRRIRQNGESSDVPIIMVTALADRENRLRAVEAGANDFISKPIDLTELRVRIASLLKMKAAQDALKQYQATLEEAVQKRTAALRQALEKMADAQRQAYAAHLDTIHRLALAAEYKDEDTAAHIHRMSHYSALLAQALHLPPGEVEIIRHASTMHDVGKIGIPDAILLKPGKLTPEEWEIMKQHTVIGARILGGSSSALLQAGEIIALSHHEKWDGSGYPQGLAGEEIPLYGRICAVADVFDALTSNRPYKKALSNEQAYEILRQGRGTHFDPQILDLFFEHLVEIEEIQQQYQAGTGHDRQEVYPMSLLRV
ncbi:MAG: response regulator [Nitrospinota bacterium]|nr:MAG: response regulator [Nitrospinota bacterium]